MTKARPSKKTSPTSPSPPPRPSAPVRPVQPRVSWLVGAALFSVLIVIAAAFQPALRLWGINHLAFVPPIGRALGIALLVLACLPFVAKPLYRAKVRVADAVGASPRLGLKSGIVTAVAIASVIGFWSARSSTLLLGDGQLIVRSFEAAEEGYEKVIMRSAKAIMNEEAIAPGTTLLYYGAIKAGAKAKKPPMQSMRVFNCILGGLMILLIGTMATDNFARGEIRLWLLTLAICSASIELFFGYIENYTTPTFLLAIYVTLAFRCIHGRSRIWQAFIPLVLAVYAHIQVILFIPSFVYLLFWARPASRRGLLRYWPAAFSATAFIGVLLAPLALPGARKFYTPLGFSNEKYALFSPHHLADVVNELFMLLPILPVVLVMWWLGRDAERAAGKDAVRDPKSLKTPVEWFTHPAEWQFVATILVPCTLYLFFFHPAIGMARDWDLFTMTTTALVPLVLLILNRYLRATGVPLESVARFAAPALMVLLVTTVAWVSVNASTERTIDRFKSILTYDRTHASYAWENLAMLQHARKQLDASIETMRIAAAMGNPRHQVRLAVYLDEAGKTEEAREILYKILERRPEFDKARFRLIMIHEKAGDWNAILPLARDGVTHSEEKGLYQFFYGESLIRAGQIEQGVQLFRDAARYQLPPSIMEHITKTLQLYAEQKQKQQQK